MMRLPTRNEFYILASGIVGMAVGVLGSHFFWTKVCPALGVLKWGE
jgi:hypothetical protein